MLSRIPINQTQQSSQLKQMFSTTNEHLNHNHNHYNQNHCNTNITNTSDNSSIANVNILNTKKNLENVRNSTTGSILCATTNLTLSHQQQHQNGIMTNCSSNSENNDTSSSSISIATSESTTSPTAPSENKNLPMEVT
jgi:hypothetical protein